MPRFIPASLNCSPARPPSSTAIKATGDFAPTFVSDNIREWLGYEPDEYLQNADFWRSRVHPDDLAVTEAESVSLFKHGRHTIEYRFRKRDGSYC